MVRTVLQGASVVTLVSMIWLGPGCGSDDKKVADRGSAGDAGAPTEGGGTGEGGEPSSSEGGTGGSSASEGGTPGTGEEGGASAGGMAGATMVGAGGALPEHLGCLGATLPETAPDDVVASGRVTTLGAVIIDGALVEGRAVADDGLLGDDTTGLNGVFSITLPTGGAPLGAYLQVSKAGNVDSYFYPPVPFATDDERDLPLLTTALRDGLAQEANIVREPSSGVVYLQVLDCNGDPIEGATVTTNPPGDMGYTGDDFIPLPDATSTGSAGTVYVFNLPPGDVEVDASVDGYSLREHTIQVRADVMTLTSVIP